MISASGLGGFEIKTEIVAAREQALVRYGKRTRVAAGLFLSNVSGNAESREFPRSCFGQRDLARSRCTGSGAVLSPDFFVWDASSKTRKSNAFNGLAECFGICGLCVIILIWGETK